MKQSVPVKPETLPERKARRAAVLDTPTDPAVVDSPARPKAPRQNDSVVAAIPARDLLEPLGWATAGKGWIDERGMSHATLACTRGAELLILTWEGGALIDQNYTLWDTTKPRNNGMPPHELDFEPDETSDRELARRITGMQVTWWNRIARNTETAIVGSKVEIRHVFNGSGDETPGERVITFADHGGAGFRSFRADALMRIGIG
jgi:hypothetical protein